MLQSYIHKTIGSLKRPLCFFSLFCLVSFGFLFFSYLAQASDQNFVNGSLRAKYEFKNAGTNQDQDLESLLTLNIGNPSQHRVTGALQGGGIFDLDGGDTGSPFYDAYNTFSSAAVARLYYAYMDVHDWGVADQLRFGRQHLYELESLYFDGASIETQAYYGLTVSAFGGIPVHQFENQMGLDAGDWLAGGALQWSPISKIQFRFDAVHLKDDAAGFRTTQGDQSDTLFGGSFWAYLGDHVDVYSRLTAFSDQTRDFELTTAYKLADHDFRVQLSLYRLLNGYDIRVIEWDAYGTAGTYVPYTQVSITTSKGVGEHFSIDSGFVARILDDSQTVSAFNHGYERFFISAATYDLLSHGLTLSTTLDYYHSEDNTLKDHNFGFSFDGTQRMLDERLTLNAGTAFYFYRYNLNLGNESDNVQTLYAGVGWNFYKTLTAKARYEFEHNDYDNFQEVNMSLNWDF